MSFNLTPNNILDFFLPRFCLSCNAKLRENKFLCPNCFVQLEFAKQELISSEFNRKFLEEKIITDFQTAFIFREDSVLQKLIHSLKYKSNFKVGKYLGVISANRIYNKIQLWDADLIIPIPLHYLKRASRGFNQAKEVSKGISEVMKIEINPKVLKRNRFTETQTKLTLSERRANVKDSFTFCGNPRKVKGKRIILVDDVITTGSTISEAARVLLEKDAKSVYALSVAIAE